MLSQINQKMLLDFKNLHSYLISKTKSTSITLYVLEKNFILNKFYL